jgi:hypothetical protein
MLFLMDENSCIQCFRTEKYEKCVRPDKNLSLKAALQGRENKKKGFCAESWQPWGEGQIPISRVWPLTFTATSHLRIIAFSTDPDRSPVCILCAMNKLRVVSYLLTAPQVT